MTSLPITPAPINVDQVRSDTPACADIMHFNNAGSALPPQRVTDAQISFLELESRIGGYEAHEQFEDHIEAMHVSAATLLGTEARNVAAVESATRAWNTAFGTIRFEEGDRILTNQSEYISNMGGLLYAQERYGVELVVVPSDESGQVDVSAMAEMIDERTRVVTLSHIPTQGGLINPAAEIGALTRDTDIIYILDACQSVGQLNVDVNEIGCDILSFTGRKFVRGPRGTGMVWVNDKTLESTGMPQGMDGSGGVWEDRFQFTPAVDARRFEVFESHVAGLVGLGVAFDYILELGIDNIEARNAVLSSSLRSKLSEVDGVTVQDLGINQCAIVTFSVDDATGAKRDCTSMKLALREQAMNVSVTSHTSARLDFPTRGLTELLRASVHYYNTEEEIDRFVAAVAVIAES